MRIIRWTLLLTAVLALTGSASAAEMKVAHISPVVELGGPFDIPIDNLEPAAHPPEKFTLSLNGYAFPSLKPTVSDQIGKDTLRFMLLRNGGDDQDSKSTTLSWNQIAG